MQTSISSRRGIRTCASFKQNTWAPLPKPLVVDSGAGETVMPVDWLTSHPLTESDGSSANDFYTTADGSKVYNEGQRKLDVCTLDGQQRRSMAFKVARVKKAMGSVSKMVKNGNKLVSDQESSEKRHVLHPEQTIHRKKCGYDRKTVCTSWT